MNAKKTIGLLVVGMLLAGVACESAFAQEINIEQKLNKEIKIGLNDVLITEALDKISKEIDVPINLSDEAEYKLPYGKSTRLSVTLKGPAYESITQMLNEFFMRYAVGQNELIIYPRPELDHIIGRPSTRQLGLLKALYTKPITVYITNNVLATANTALEQEFFVSPINVLEDINTALRKLAGDEILSTQNPGGKPQYRYTLPSDAEGNQLKEYALSTPVIFPQLLREVKVGNNTTEWYIPAIDLPNQTPEIRIVDENRLRYLKYGQLIDVNFEDNTLMEIFQNLADRGSINYTKIPQVIPYLEERMTVSMQNITAVQAMKKIADMAQLHYENRNYNEFFIIEKIKPTPSIPAVAPAKPETNSDDRGPYVGKISIPMEGGKYYIEYMLRESDLTDELKKLRSEKIKEILGSQTKEESLLKAAEEAK